MPNLYLQISIISILSFITLANIPYNGIFNLQKGQDTSICCLPQNITWNDSRIEDNVLVVNVAYEWPNCSYITNNPICTDSWTDNWNNSQNDSYIAMSDDNGITWFDILGYTYIPNENSYTILFSRRTGPPCGANYTFVEEFDMNY